MTTVFMEKTKEDSLFWEITLDEANTNIITSYGKVKHDYRFVPSREMEKSFETMEKAEKYFHKAIKDKKKGGYVESDRAFPLELHHLIEEVQRGTRSKLDIKLTDPKPLKEICSLSQLTHLEIDYRGTSPYFMPPELANLKELESLSINKISGPVPPELGELKKLNSLAIVDSSLSSLPKEIGNLTNLTYLNLQSNQLTSLPSSMKNLSKMQDINLNENLLSSFPAELTSMTNLEEIRLNDNEISSLDKGIRNLKKLKELYMTGLSHQSKACLREFPKVLIELSSLTRLNLAHHEIKEIPENITKMDNLERLILRGNPITNVPEDVIRQTRFRGVKGIDDFFNKPKEEPKKKVEIRVEPVTCSEEERLALLKPYQATLKKISESYYSRQNHPEQLDQTLSYIKGESPLVPQSDDARIYDDDIIRLFRPHHDNWTFVEPRLIKMITQEEMWESGRGHRSFMPLIKDMIQRGQGEGLLEKVLPLLEKEGITREWVRDYMCRHFTDILLEKENTASAAGDFLLQYYSNDWKHMLQLLKEDRDKYLKMFRFFAATRTNDFETHFDEVLKNPNTPGATFVEQILHAPYEEWEILMDLDKERFYPRFSQLFTEVNCEYCLFRLAQIGMKHYPEVNEAPLLAVTRDVLKAIEQTRSLNSEYKFHCPVYMEKEAQKATWYDYYKKDLDKTYDLIQWSLQAFGEKAGSILLDYLLNTAPPMEEGIALCVKSLGQEMEPLVLYGLSLEAEKGNLDSLKVILSAAKSISPSPACEERLWALLYCDIEEIRDAAARALAGKNPRILEKVKEGLTSKDIHQRDGAIRLLCFERTQESQAVLEEILFTEKKDDIRDLILNNWANEWNLSLEEVKSLIQKAQDDKKLNRPVKAWLDVSSLPRLYWSESGVELSDIEMKYLFYRQNREKQITVEGEIQALLKHIDHHKSGDFAHALFELLMANGGPAAKNRFALTLAGVLGDERLVAPLEEFTIKRNNEACPTALGLIKSDAALRALNRIMRHFKTKYPNVKGAAHAAFTQAAEEKGVSYYELADSIISTFGFDGLTRTLMIDDKSYTIRIGEDLKLIYRDEEKGKTVKTLPKAASPELKEEIKSLAKEIRENTKEILNNLEQYFVIQRKWSMEDWDSFFLNHPLLFVLTPQFVWGVYQEEKLTATFRFNGEGDFLNADGEEIDLPMGDIGLVHPFDMKEDAIATWKEQLTDYEITQSFPQLEREIHSLREDELNVAFCNRFKDREVGESAFKSRTEKRGWRRGSVVDGGGVDNYLKTFEKEGIDVFIELQGMCVSSIGEPAELKELYFVTQGSVVTGSYTYDSPRSEGDSRLIKLKDVPAIIFSEVIGDMEFITK